MNNISKHEGEVPKMMFRALAPHQSQEFGEHEICYKAGLHL